MFNFKRERHINLHNGKGLIAIVKARFSKGREAARITVSPHASIGWHTHPNGLREIYFTFNRDIRFNDARKWTFVQICKRGEKHKVENFGRSFAKVYALKF